MPRPLRHQGQANSWTEALEGVQALCGTLESKASLSHPLGSLVGSRS